MRQGFRVLAIDWPVTGQGIAKNMFVFGDNTAVWLIHAALRGPLEGTVILAATPLGKFAMMENAAVLP